MHSEHIDVSYFAAGIVAHLTSEVDGGCGNWPIKCTTKDEILQDLVTTEREFMSWGGSGRGCFQLG